MIYPEMEFNEGDSVLVSELDRDGWKGVLWMIDG